MDTFTPSIDRSIDRSPTTSEYGGRAPSHEHTEREDDDAHLTATSPAGQHAGVGSSFFRRCLPNRQGSERSLFWSAFMFCMEIPPHLEKNMYVCVCVWGEGGGDELDRFGCMSWWSQPLTHPIDQSSCS